ncbi:hypothetical protein ACH473_10685 [Cellulosimicrobium funkei]|jgi:hypothetical protein|uniref:hypothetical protein n=1 Tax=Cellulosimicrobium funkei TaxID=264251 RepID=UPI003757791A
MTSTTTRRAPAARKTGTAAAKRTSVPAAAKKPADRKPATQKRDQKAEAGDESTEVVVTYDGITVTITRDAANDFELLEDLDEIDAGNAAKFPSAIRRLVGPEQYANVKAHFRDGSNGRVDAERVAKFFYAIFEELNPNS